MILEVVFELLSEVVLGIIDSEKFPGAVRYAITSALFGLIGLLFVLVAVSAVSIAGKLICVLILPLIIAGHIVVLHRIKRSGSNKA